MVKQSTATNKSAAFRMKVVSHARAFKRSWVDMAEALTAVRSRGLYRAWGFETLQSYALEELNIKKSTCDKLTGSYYAMESHVPHVLRWDGVAQPLPELDAVDYFRRAVDPEAERRGELDPALLDELKAAVFEEQRSAPSVRRSFQPRLFPKDDDTARRELIDRVRSNARRLEGLVSEVDGLSEERVENVTVCLEELREDLDQLQRSSAE